MTGNKASERPFRAVDTKSLRELATIFDRDVLEARKELTSADLKLQARLALQGQVEEELALRGPGEAPQDAPSAPQTDDDLRREAWGRYSLGKLVDLAGPPLKGTIQVGDHLVWEPNRHHATEFVEVVEIQSGRYSETMVKTRSLRKGDSWNDESRIREACARDVVGDSRQVHVGDVRELVVIGSKSRWRVVKLTKDDDGIWGHVVKLGAEATMTPIAQRIDRLAAAVLIRGGTKNDEQTPPIPPLGKLDHDVRLGDVRLVKFSGGASGVVRRTRVDKQRTGSEWFDCTVLDNSAHPEALISREVLGKSPLLRRGEQSNAGDPSVVRIGDVRRMEDGRELRVQERVAFGWECVILATMSSTVRSERVRTLSTAQLTNMLLVRRGGS